MAVGIDSGERGLADAAQAVQRRDGDAALIPGERRLDCGERVVAAEVGTRIGMLETAKTLPGKATAAGANRTDINSRKRRRAASCAMPNSSQRRR